LPQAASLAAEIESNFGVSSELIPSKGGCFEVVADDQLVFSKNNEDRFPENAEVIVELTKLAANQ
jgi:selT/selW/selH-like putative selenoprotein